MYVDGDIEEPISKSSDKTYGKLLHEYIHYLQHITTLFGIKICEMFNNLFSHNLFYCKENKTIDIPLNVFDDNAKRFLDHFNKVKGDRFCNNNISDIEIYESDIEIARQSHNSVNIGIYDFENNKAIEDGFRFGYYCVIETMAHLIQSFVDPHAPHNVIPYQSGIIIFEKYLNRKCDLAKERINIIIICYCSLFHDNPGVAFFDYLKFVKNNNGIDCIELYNCLMKYKINIKGKQISIKSAFVLFLDRYENVLKSVIGCDLNYYHNVIKNCKIDFINNRNLLLEILIDGRICDKETFENVLAPHYGYPYIEANNTHLIPPYVETAVLRGLELLMKRLYMYRPNTECPWFRICKSTMYEADSQVTEECMEEQWNKTEECIMTEAFRYYKLKGKDYVQH